MFSYRCPACGKQHQIDTPFKQSFDAPCLRCREIIHVTAELVSDAGAALAAIRESAAAKNMKKNERARPAATSEEAAASGPEAAGTALADFDAEQAIQEAEKIRLLSQKSADADSEEPTGGKKKKRKRPPADQTEDSPAIAAGRRNWTLLVGIAVLVVGLVGAGGYFGYDAFRKRKPTGTAEAKISDKTATKATPTTSQTKSSTSKEKTAAATKEKTTAAATKDKATVALDKSTTTANVEMIEPIVKPRDDKVLHIGAAQLSSELAADAAATNTKYHAAILEVSGIYDRLEPRETARPPARPHLIFRCEGPPVLCDQFLSKTPPGGWAKLRRDDPCTIRGVYGKDGVLHSCEVLPLSPPADVLYRGKDMEVSGHVAQALAADHSNPYPRILLEKETQGKTVIECLFRKSDEDKVLSAAVDAPIIVRGVCGGRHRDQSDGPYFIRLDNCELVFTTSPPADRQRIAAPVLLRAYEEDLYGHVLPPVDGGTRMEKLVSLDELEKEFASDPKDFAGKYRHKLMTVSGIANTKSPGPSGILLTNGETNGVVAVQCRFSPRALKELEAGPKHTVQGLCTGMANPKTLMLENCEALDASGQRTARRLTPDFFPHTPGITLTYDFAQPAAKSQLQVTRLMFEQHDKGMIETLTTHNAVVKTATLFQPGERDTWTKNTKAQKVRLPGYVFRHRIQGRFVELGRLESKREGVASEIVYEPVLKLGTKPGESWTWSNANIVHEYKLAKFDTYQNRPSALIEETVTASADPHHPHEISHLYVSGIGEVERRDYLRVTSKEKQLVSERRLVEEPQKTQ
jgi:predicted negative regulator of RcsB-dependent stress response